ncbi:T9SS type A sorting domain-containing protein [Winogradskyella echinorum]|uniref:T9SS type A sorting domain-containing protein n=1 Tax=Winogradskyella echinorum TaxID=538189 RepID=A0ABR6Y0J3_9FLAO|nr:T9SS type A sorting domain-containing protein [Winogradskyella echinorum]MBC3845778.1 T9SS type A sorting domain-containing protein [Winogradskyella echinorum]MBC5750126.1 T9SS type A sorting domain-containing protein [Winogradskyella echinorum]
MKKLLLLFILIPFIGFSQTQIGQDILGNDYESSGTRVDISSDGSIIAIGSPGNIIGNSPGRISIYRNLNGTWTQIGQDIVGITGDDEEGISLSLSGDGSIIAISSYRYYDNINSGHVRIFKNINNTWTLLGQEIYGTPSVAQSFGYRVELSSDGTTVMVAYEYTPVKILRYINGIWTQIGQEIDGGYSNYKFGNNIDISSDGNRIAIGDQDGLNDSRGKVQVYEYNGVSWTQIGQDIIGTDIFDTLGASLSLSSNGEIVAVSAYFADPNGSNSGEVKVFKLINNTWTQLGQNLNGDAQDNNYGMGVALSNDGNIVAIGSPNNSNNASFSGHVKVFQFNNSNPIFSNWIQRGIDIEGNISDQLGNSVALSSDGRTLIAGAFSAGTNGNGLARVYDLGNILSINKISLDSFILYPNPTKSQFTIQLNNTTELKNANIYNNLGQKVLTSKKAIIDTSKLAPGLYVVEIETNKGKSSKKLIIN